MIALKAVAKVVINQLVQQRCSHKCLNYPMASFLVSRPCHPIISPSRGIRGQNLKSDDDQLAVGAPGERVIYEPVERPELKMSRVIGPRELRMAKMLFSRDFENDQIELILNHFDLENNRDLDIDLMRTALDFWLLEMKPPKVPVLPKKSEEWNHFNWRKASIQSVIASTEPDLLLIDPDAMKWRMEKLLELGFMNGKGDLYRTFVFAPRAYYLQDWVEFLRKFRYLHHRILQWLLVGKDDPYPIPHPCIEHASVMQLSYEQIKSRFEFVLRTGVRSPVGSGKSMVKRTKGLTFETLLLSETEKFLKTLAPGVTEEEFNVFEKMISANPDDEDDTIAEIAELESQGYTDRDIERKVKKVSKFASKYGQKNEEREEEEYKTRFSKLTD